MPGINYSWGMTAGLLPRLTNLRKECLGSTIQLLQHSIGWRLALCRISVRENCYQVLVLRDRAGDRTANKFCDEAGARDTSIAAAIERSVNGCLFAETKIPLTEDFRLECQ